MSALTRRKSLTQAGPPQGGHALKRTLSWPHLIGMGVGAIVGTGIYTLVGTGADKAGPAVILSFAIAGLVCAAAALAYAELASMMPASGSAYTYSYVSMGEGVAWLVGWALILEYTVVVSAVAVGWSGYFVGFLEGVGVHLPAALTSAETAKGGFINLPAVLIVFAVAGALMVGLKESATVNAWLVVLKLVALLAFVVLALPHFDAARFAPFMPHGFGAHPEGETTKGVMAAAAIIFFAFYGFDAVSTAAEETKNPSRDLAIGILGSMVICTVLYMVVAAAALGAMAYPDFAASKEPLAQVIRTLGHPEAAALIAGVAVVALPTVILAFLYGQSRIFFVMARDGLLPRRLGAVSGKSGAPVAVTLVTAVVCSALAALLDLNHLAALANAGTLAAFIAVSAALLVMRRIAPDAPRPFRAPLAPLVAFVAIGGCLYLFASLAHTTQIYFAIWMAIGVVGYFLWGVRHSALAKG
ncbi:MAG: amino acid permease [Caulobacterales bacterium]|jgi:APA family basic amino acid/polyamine antiporter